jgi:hypothetical protein
VGGRNIKIRAIGHRTGSMRILVGSAWERDDWTAWLSGFQNAVSPDGGARVAAFRLRFGCGAGVTASLRKRREPSEIRVLLSPRCCCVK